MFLMFLRHLFEAKSTEFKAKVVLLTDYESTCFRKETVCVKVNFCYVHTPISSFSLGESQLIILLVLASLLLLSCCQFLRFIRLDMANLAIFL